MTDKALEDLETIKKFITTGRKQLKDNGFFLMFWGILIPIATVGNSIILKHFNPQVLAWYWPAMMIAGTLVSVLVGLKKGRESKAVSFSDRINGLLWLGFIIAVTAGILSAYLKGEFSPLGLLRPVCILLGFAYWMYSALLQMNWLKIFALGWWILAVIISLLPWDPASWIMGGGTFLLSFTPGIILRLSPKE